MSVVMRLVRRRRFGALTAGVIALLAGASASLAQPIIVEEIVRNTPGGIVRGYIATVDLQHPQVEIVTTAGTAGTCDTALTTTTSFRSTNNLSLAINANFFGTGGACTAGRGDVIGVLASNGSVVSPPRQFGSFGDPALNITAAKIATIDNFGSTATGFYDAIAGVGPSNTDTDPGTFLVTNGANTGATARVTPSTREPRTGVGVSRDGKTLYLAVVDGRQPTWSVGMTLPEFADIFVQKGAWRAINLDGGGSSSFVYLRPNNTVLQNQPSDGSFRSVASNFGVRLNAAPAITDRLTRPIRGAWMRPPGSSTAFPNTPDFTTFENTVSTLAAAGIQDLFLETLFWGRDTARNNDPNFPSRFGTNDFLAQAIVIAARYGVRIHAWCETGYLDFGASPSPLLAANPDWVQRHVSVARNNATPNTCTGTNLNTLTGDLANQRFVNLGNPGVRAALNGYFTRLATNYPALEGIQADYHFFSLGNSPANLDNAAPWSYDNWALANFRDANGNLVNPLNSVTNCLGTVTYNSTTWVVNSGAHPNWINWNRRNVTDALVQLRAAVEGVSGSPLFSAVSFGAWSSPVHISKMIDLPNWGTQLGAEAAFIMAYQTSATNIANELSLAQTAWPNRRVVAGLANLTNTTRPTITQQLNAMNGRGIQDFCWFDAPTFISNSAGSQATMRAELRTWIDTVATPQVGDINRDGYIDARDLTLFNTLFVGSPITTTAPNQRYDLNNDGVINQTDRTQLNQQFNRFKFGEDGIVNARDLTALRNCFTPGTGFPAPTALLHLWDLNGDGAVDWRDELICLDAFTSPRNETLDVNGDTRIDIDDLYAQLAAPIDVGGDGMITPADAAILVRALRSGEATDTTNGTR